MIKNVIVTGAAGNMGRAVVLKFLQEGYFVTGTVSSKRSLSYALSHDSYISVAVDLSDEAASAKFVAETIEKRNQIDVAVLTVGGFAMGNIANTSSGDIFKQYQLNFETAYNVARPVFVKMLEQGHGRIFLVGSRPGLNAKASKGMIGYGLAKSLIFRLGEMLNEEAAGTDVVVSVLVPSTIDTPQNRKSMPAANFDSWVTPKMIADCIYFYCTDEAAALREPIIKLYNKA